MDLVWEKVPVIHWEAVRWLGFVALAGLSACGRIGFDLTSEDMDSDPDSGVAVPLVGTVAGR